MTQYPLLEDGAWLREQYVDREQSISQIAKAAGSPGTGTVRKALLRAGVTMRPARFHTPPAVLARLEDGDWLRARYNAADLPSVPTLAAEIGTSEGRLRAALVRFNIPRRKGNRPLRPSDWKPGVRT